MTKTELLERIANGEDSETEFKRDSIDKSEVAKEVCAFANLKGGWLVFGVEDDRGISGVVRDDIEEWLMNISRTALTPPLITSFYRLREVEEGKDVVVLEVPQAPTKPCRAKRGGREIAYIRAGTTVREPSDDELAGMFQQTHRLNFGKLVASGAELGDFSMERLKQYGSSVLDEDWSEIGEHLQQLRLLELLAEEEDVPSINGLLLFGTNPRRALPQSGIRAIAYRGNTPSHEVREDAIFDLPMVGLFEESMGRRRFEGVASKGLVEEAIDFLARHTEIVQNQEKGRQLEAAAFHPEVLREVIVNALVHRDYTIWGTDILLEVFDDRLEVTSPGRLPNGGSVEALREGFRYARNQVLVQVMRDYGYVDHRGMGIRGKILPLTLEHSGQAALLTEKTNSFTVTIPRRKL